jgi:hypothetical protein
MSLSSNNQSTIRSAVATTGVTSLKNDLQLGSNGTAKTLKTTPINKNSSDSNSESNNNSNDQGEVAKDSNGIRAQAETTLHDTARETALRQQAEQREQQAMLARMMGSQQNAAAMQGAMQALGDASKDIASALGQAKSNKKQDGSGSGGGAKPGEKPPENIPKQQGQKQQEQKQQEQKQKHLEQRQQERDRTQFNQQSRPVDPSAESVPEALRNSVVKDVARVRGEEDPSSRSRSLALLNEYGSKYDLSKNDKAQNDATRRLVMHGVELKDFEAVKSANPSKSPGELASLAISQKNERELSQTNEGSEALKFLKEMGFDKDELHQITSKQALDMYKDYKEAKEEHTKNPEDTDRQSKQALVLVSNNHPEFDLSGELTGLMKHQGIERVFVMQIDNEDMLKKGGPVSQLAEKVGGFGLLVDGGHGAKDKAGIIFGRPQDLKPGEDDSKRTLYASDLVNKPEIQNLYKDESVFLKGFSHVSLSCNFAGGDKIKAEDSMQATFQSLRPDANINGPSGEVPSFARFETIDGKLYHSNIKGDDGQLAELNLLSSMRSEEDSFARSDNNIDNIDISFADDDIDIDFDFD